MNVQARPKHPDLDGKIFAKSKAFKAGTHPVMMQVKQANQADHIAKAI